MGTSSFYLFLYRDKSPYLILSTKDLLRSIISKKKEKEVSVGLKWVRLGVTFLAQVILGQSSLPSKTLIRATSLSLVLSMIEMRTDPTKFLVSRTS